MITLIRFIRLKQLEIKYKLAFWQFINKEFNTLIKNREEIEKKFVDSLAEIIHRQNQSN